MTYSEMRQKYFSKTDKEGDLVTQMMIKSSMRSTLVDSPVFNAMQYITHLSAKDCAV